ncbi:MULTISPECIES: hypothetical protein [unclassified Streptomyces]|uniref:hypothetical protein n=1 Tax=unclassified Streptomyces TaxID=2593676 RepID=UPI0016552537|nr:hypothetical protein [Streptomyces sp. CB02980]MCB8905486.1 hypothetical protein [Streptomyces sp. CB02980]
MRIGTTGTSILLAGALLCGLSACSSDSGANGGGASTRGASGGGAANGGDAGSADGAPLSSKIAAPSAFDTAKGWEVEAEWLPQGQPLPYAVSQKAGTVAHLDKTGQGYVLKVREAASGKVLSTSRPWQGPKPTEKQADETSGALAVPQIALVSGLDREYFAVWARGEARSDELHEYKEVVAVAFYPADASGKDMTPVGAGNAEAPDGEFDRPGVLPGPGGLVVTSYGGDSILVSVDGKVHDTSDAKVSLNGKSTDPDFLMSFPSAKGLVTNGDDRFGGDGGFGADGGWQSTRVAPPGVEAVLKKESVGSGMTETPNGRIAGAAGSYVIANWLTAGDGVSAVHDLSTGAVRATAPCRTDDTEYAIRIPGPGSGAGVKPALSPDDRFLVTGGTVFDLRTGKGTCADRGQDAKEITLSTVGDDGTAYGTAGERPPLTPVSVSATTGAATPLPEATALPAAMASGAGLFVTYAGTDTMRLIALHLKK